MDSFQLNKILGAVLATLLVVMGLSIVSEAIYKAPKPAKPGYVIAVAAEAPAAGAAPVAQDPPVGTLLASAKPESGASIAKKCQACHNLTEGAGAKVGPDLYSVVDRQIGGVEGFKYSATFQKAHDAGEKWTYDNLYAFLKKPSAVRPGTAMGFAGLPKPEDRADVISYLRTLSHSPEPLPAAAGAAPAAPASTPATAPPAPAAGAAPAAGGAAPAAAGSAPKPAGPTSPALSTPPAAAKSAPTGAGTQPDAGKPANQPSTAAPGSAPADSNQVPGQPAKVPPAPP
jgi:cytochrome c